jgi:hypothetical protein
LTRLDWGIRVRLWGWAAALVIALAMLALAGGCATIPTLRPLPPTVAQQLLAAHNDERAQDGVPPLVLDASLTVEAQSHAEWMASTGRLEHVRRGVAEDIARGYPDVQSAVDNWMCSPPHRANILSPHYTRFGGGMARSRSGQLYWCARFAAATPAVATDRPSASYCPPLRDGEMFVEYLGADGGNHSYIFRPGESPGSEAR